MIGSDRLQTAKARLRWVLENKEKWTDDHQDVTATTYDAAKLMGLRPGEFAWQMEVWMAVAAVDAYERRSGK